MSYEVRPATLDDADDLIAFWNDAGLHLYPETPMLAEIESILVRNPAAILVAFNESESSVRSSGPSMAAEGGSIGWRLDRIAGVRVLPKI